MEKGILIDTKDDKEYGIVRELNNIEKVFLKFVSNNNAIPITILRLKHRIDNEIFKKAVYLVCDKNELLHSCITQKNGNLTLLSVIGFTTKEDALRELNNYVNDFNKPFVKKMTH